MPLGWSALAALGLAATWVAANQRPPGLDHHALRVAEAFVAGDAETLVAYANPDELALVGLDSVRAKLMVAELVTPRVKRWQDIEPAIETRLFALGAQGVARVHWKGGGREAVLMFDVEPTDHGPRSRLVVQLLRAWDLEHRRLHPSQALEATPEGRLAGLEQDRNVLEKLGLKGVAKRDLSEPFTPWDEMERIWRAGTPGSKGSGTSN